jgi:hypothetical protein
MSVTDDDSYAAAAAAAKFKTNQTKLVRRRAGYKANITSALKLLIEMHRKHELTRDILDRQEISINKWNDVIESLNSDLLDLFDDADIDLNDPGRLEEISKEVMYQAQIQTELSKLSSNFPIVINIPATNANSNNDQLFAAALNKLQTVEVKPPILKCTTFSGTGADRLEFKNFLVQFQNCVDAGGRLPHSAKLTYLRSYLTGYAFKIISHLSINNENYDIALHLLRDEFLDIEYIIDESMKQFMDNSPKFDYNFGEVRLYLNETRALLYELKTYDIDLMEDGSAGAKLASHIIFSKLPNILKRELVHKVNNNFPSIREIFGNYSDIIKTLSITTKPKFSKDPYVKNRNRNFNPRSEWKTKDGHAENKASSESPSTLENFKVTVSNVKNPVYKNSSSAEITRYCKFCTVHGHSMTHCNRYDTYDSRQKRCRDLKLCVFCSSNKHDRDGCPGKNEQLSFKCFNCQSKGHISALCCKVDRVPVVQTNSNVCLNMRQDTNADTQPLLLPVITVNFSKGKNIIPVNCKVLN